MKEYNIQKLVENKGVNMLDLDITYDVDEVLEYYDEDRIREYVEYILKNEKEYFNDTATTEIYTSLFVGSVRCV